MYQFKHFFRHFQAPVLGPLKTALGTIAGLCLLLLIPLVIPSSVAAGGGPDQNNDRASAGKLMKACAKCHGENGQGGEDGKYPRLAGIPAKYLARQLRLFQSWERENVVMNPCITEQNLSDHEIDTISSHISKMKISFKVDNVAGDIPAGRKLYIKKCKKCHGKNGVGKGFKPQLAGQYPSYLRSAMADYTSGKRKYAMMKRYFEQMTPEDIDNLLAYLTSRDD